jgi:hypothetical protein
MRYYEMLCQKLHETGRTTLKCPMLADIINELNGFRHIHPLMRQDMGQVNRQLEILLKKEHPWCQIELKFEEAALGKTEFRDE